MHPHGRGRLETCLVLETVLAPPSCSLAGLEHRQVCTACHARAPYLPTCPTSGSFLPALPPTLVLPRSVLDGFPVARGMLSIQRL